MFAVDSSFDTAQGNKASHFAREATLMAGFDDLVDVFVGLRLFLGDTPTRGTADDDATFCEAGAYCFTAGVAGGLVTAQYPPSTMRGGKEAGLPVTPASTYDAVPIVPGISTGWPTAASSAGSS